MSTNSHRTVTRHQTVIPLPSGKNRQKTQPEGVHFCQFGTQNVVKIHSYRLLFRRFCPPYHGSSAG